MHYPNAIVRLLLPFGEFQHGGENESWSGGRVYREALKFSYDTLRSTRVIAFPFLMYLVSTGTCPRSHQRDSDTPVKRHRYSDG